MTHADRVRAHAMWPAYQDTARVAGDELATLETRRIAAIRASQIAEVISADLCLTQSQRYDLPHLAKRRPTMGRPRKPAERFRVCCPHCDRAFEVEPPR